MLRVGIMLALMLAPVTATAQTLKVSETMIRTCAAGTPYAVAQPTCAGDAANICQSLPDGSTTNGIVACLQAETDVWDAMLNEEYGKARIAFDSIGGEDLTTSLRDAQRAWIAFRDADCTMRYHQWIGGTIRSVVSASCHLQMTASRAIALRDLARNEP